VAPIEGKGLGLVALRDIMPYESAMAEFPILHLAFDWKFKNHRPGPNFHTLDEEGKADALDTLMKVNPNWHQLQMADAEKRKLMSLCDASDDNTGTLADKIACNMMGLYTVEQRPMVFHMLSRLNHSCRPNAYICDDRWDHELQILMPTRTIRKGEELCIDYFREVLMFFTRDERKERLLKWASIDCKCEACSLTGKELEESNANRLELEAVANEIEVLQKPSVKVLEKVVDKKRKLLIKEGLDTRDHMILLSNKLLEASITPKDKRKYQREIQAHGPITLIPME